MTRRTTFATAVAIVSLLSLVGCSSERAASLAAPTSALATPSGTQTSETNASNLTVGALVSGTSCPTLQFTISTYLFKTSASTQYSGGSCTSLRAGTTVSFDYTRPNPTENVFYLSRITIISGGATTPAPGTTSVKTDGTVTSVVTGTSCPDLQFKFGTYLFKMSSATLFSQASCVDVKVGEHVYIAGTKRESDAFIAVTGLGIKRDETTPTPPTEPEPEPPAPRVTLDGTVTSLVAGASCPYMQFLFGSYSFTTSAVTYYENGNCGDLKPGASVTIVGAKRDDNGGVLVSKVSFKRDGSSTTPPASSTGAVTGEGTVTGLLPGSACPTLSFLVGTYTVNVTAATQYEGGTCASIATGSKVVITGTKAGEDTVVASRLVIENVPAPAPQLVQSTSMITGRVTGTVCPALSFSFGAYTIKVDAATEYENGDCSDLRIKTTVSIRGVVVGEKTVLASFVSFPD